MLFEPHPAERDKAKSKCCGIRIFDTMISLLIISQNKQAREDYTKAFCKEHAIDHFDITVFQPENSIGIEDVRELQKKAFLKPFKSQEKALVIHNAQQATNEAQNALLKLLEEPPTNTYIILTADSSRPFLPTVLSRCKIISLDSHTEHIDLAQEEMIEQLLSFSIAEKLFFAQNLTKNKEEALPKLEILLHAAHKKMQENPENRTYARITELLADTYNKAVNTNINLRFLLEHALLQLK